VRTRALKRLGWFILAGCILIAAAIMRRAAPEPGTPGDRIVRTYDVSDLINLPPAQAVEDSSSPPTIVPAKRLGVQPYVGGGSGGGSLYGSGSGSGGDGPDAQTLRLDELVNYVRSGIDPESWSNGVATITHFGRRLVVVQTRENQRLIEDLLAELRANPPRQVRLDIIWATLGPDDLHRLIIAGKSGPTRVDLNALQRVSGAIVWRGQIVCASGQRSRLTCGRAYTVPTQIESVFTGADAAFVSNSQELLDGATIEILPSLSPDGASVTLDLVSDVTRRGSPGGLPPFEIPVPVSPAGTPAGGVARIDRLNLGVQSLATSIRGPTAQALVVGGATDPDASDADPRQLYLIIRASEASKTEARR
jgi:hypothetical protein